MGIQIPALHPVSLSFPDVQQALDEPRGLLAYGGDLRPERLLAAYRRGIFPWYEAYLSDGSPSPILWWCPQPRCVLYVDELKISRSLEKRTRNAGFWLSCNQAFEAVIKQCAGKRSYTNGTWIVPDMQNAYVALHQLGHAHSVECWLDDELVGGLYGVSIGRMFFGESMFSAEKDASKITLRYLCKLLKNQQSWLIDCQIINPHLASMGAREIALPDFLASLEAQVNDNSLSFPANRIPASSLCEA